MKLLMMLIALACAGAAPHGPPDDHLREVGEKVAEDFGGIVDVDFVVTPCGQINAFYLEGSVYLCRELARLPDDALRFFAAHELAHAVVDQLRLSDEDSEARADELAALVLLASDDEAAVEAMADYFLRDPQRGGEDEHPKNVDRARMLLCLEDGHDEHPEVPYCRLYFRQAASGWMRLIETRARDDRGREDEDGD